MDKHNLDPAQTAIQDATEAYDASLVADRAVRHRRLAARHGRYVLELDRSAIEKAQSDLMLSDGDVLDGIKRFVHSKLYGWHRDQAEKLRSEPRLYTTLISETEQFVEDISPIRSMDN